jgi:hypothetical protein
MSSGYAAFNSISGDYLQAADFLTGETSAELFVRWGFDGNSAPWLFGSDTQGEWQNLNGSVYSAFGSTLRRAGVGVAAINTWYTTDVWSAPNDFALYEDENLIMSSGTNTVGWYSTPTLGWLVTTANFLGGSIAELLIYDHKLGASDRTAVKSYMAGIVSGSL